MSTKICFVSPTVQFFSAELRFLLEVEEVTALAFEELIKDKKSSFEKISELQKCFFSVNWEFSEKVELEFSVSEEKSSEVKTRFSQFSPETKKSP